MKSGSYVPLVGRDRAKSALSDSGQYVSVGRKPALKTVNRTMFCRYELKYRISEIKAAMVAEFVRPHLHIDHYSKLQPGGAYPIVSLYLDSDELTLCRETFEGKKNRFKLRVRSYSDKAENPCFFELKRRINNVIYKSRTRVPRESVAALIAGRHLAPREYATDEAALKQFQLYMKYIDARPLILVRYLRQAFESDTENRVRITMDRQLCYNVMREPDVRFDVSGWQRHSADFVILEIKFTSRFPQWLSHMVKYLDLKQEAMSKYASSVKQCCRQGFCAPELLDY